MLSCIGTVNIKSSKALSLVVAPILFNRLYRQQTLLITPKSVSLQVMPVPLGRLSFHSRPSSPRIQEVTDLLLNFFMICSPFRMAQHFFKAKLIREDEFKPIVASIRIHETLLSFPKVFDMLVDCEQRLEKRHLH